MAQAKQIVGKCGFLAIVMMLFTGLLFGLIGVITAHFAITFFPEYYLILIFPIILAIILGFGLSQGARIGGCSRMNSVAALLVLFLVIGFYGLLLFLNVYCAQLDPKPETIVQEALVLAEDGQNFLATLPYAADYIKPVANSTRQDQHLGVSVVKFLTNFPELALAKPVKIGTFFHFPLFNSIRDYLAYPGVTDWFGEEGVGGTLIFDQTLPVQEWLRWTVELLLMFGIALLFTKGGVKIAHKRYVKQLDKAGISMAPKRIKPPKEKKPVAEKKKKKTQGIPATEEIKLAPELEEEAQQAAQEKAEEIKKAKPPKQKKKGFSLFGRKKTAEEQAEDEQAEAESAHPEKLAIPFPEDPAGRYALILHQFDRTREQDVLMLIQSVGQVPPDKAQKLLKVPSLLKRDVSADEARIAIEKFNQVQALVKLITMEQLNEIQKKQQAAQPPPVPPSAPPQAAAPSKPSAQPQQSPPVQGSGGDRYALILKSIDPAQRSAVLQLLSSLSGRPADQLQSSLKPPALVLRDATKDEVMMISQQFQNLGAEVKIVSMAELQRLMTKK